MARSGFQKWTFLHTVGVIHRRRYAALCTALVLFSAFVWGGIFWPKKYETSATVFIERSSLIDPLIKGVGVSIGVEERLRNLKNSVLSRNILERVSRKLGLHRGLQNEVQREGRIAELRKGLKVTVKSSRDEREADLFIISFRGKDPVLARDVVNTLVSEYIEESVRSRRTDAYDAFSFIQKQLMEYKGKLEESDRETREFRERNPRMVPQSEAALLGRLEVLRSARSEADIRLKELLRKRDSLQKQLSGEREMTVAFVTREGSPRTRLEQLNGQLSLLMARYTDRHPEVIRVLNEIEELKRQSAQGKEQGGEGAGYETASLNPVYQQLKEELSRADAEVESLRARSAELARQQGEVQTILGSMPREQEEWSKLQRDRTVYQKIYDDLLQKLENARVSKDLELSEKTASFRVIDPAMLPLSPLSPNVIVIMGVGFLLSVAAGIGAALGLDRLDPSYKEEEEIEADLRLPVLGSIPSIVTEEDTRAVRRRDRRVYAAAGAYFLVLALFFMNEVLLRYAGVSVFPF
ncbi:MAG: XrtA system polysaccharide chain length determinant [Thermodesulfovibrionales bacterium]